MKKNIYDKPKSGPFVVRENVAQYGNKLPVVASQGETNKKYSVISLFSGCGGLDLGFVGGFDFLKKKYSKKSFKIIWANDIDESSCQTFANYFKHDIVCGDITEILSGKFAARLFDQPLPKKADIVLGGFPCQDFSHAGKRGVLIVKEVCFVEVMMEMIKRTNHILFVAENVRGLLTINKTQIQTI